MSLHKWIGIAGTVAVCATLSVTSARAQGTTYDSAAKTTDSTAHHHMKGMKGGYSATLTSPSGEKVGGMAWVHGDKAMVKLTGDSAGVERPWHVHIGSCGNDMGIFGTPSDYKPIKVGSDGTGKGEAKMSMPLPDTGSYFVNIHASMSDMKTIVACGPLTKNM